MTKLCHQLIGFFIVTGLISCGYEDSSGLRTWKFEQEAQARASEAPKVLFGENVPGYSGETAPKECPAESICVKAAYFSSTQMDQLASNLGAYFSVTKADDKSFYKAEHTPNLYLIADVIHLPTSTEFQVCSGETIIVTSKFDGGGVVNGSGAVCGRKNGSNMRVVAPILQNVRFISNGQDGGAGTEIKKIEPAANGDPKAFDLKIETRWESKSIPLTVGACEGEPEKRKTVDANFKLLEDAGLYSVKEFRSWIKEFLASGSLAEFYNDQSHFEYEDKLLCWFEAPGNDGMTEYLSEAKVAAENVDKLNGADAKEFAGGPDGANGGDAGLIEIITTDLTEPHFFSESKNGVGEKGHPAVFQRPGLGVQPEKKEITTEFKIKSRIFCKGEIVYEVVEYRNGQVVGTETRRTSHPGFDKKTERDLSLSFGLGKPTLYRPEKGYLGDILLTSDYKGSDGAAIPEDQSNAHAGRDGKPGTSREPIAKRYSKKADLNRDLHSICAFCEMPQALEE